MLKKIRVKTHIGSRFFSEIKDKEIQQEFSLDSAGNVSLTSIIFGGFDLEDGSRKINKHIDTKTAEAILNDMLNYFENNEPALALDGDTYYFTMYYDSGKKKEIFGSASCAPKELSSLCDKIRNIVRIENLYLFDTYSFEEHDEPDFSEMELDL